MRKKNRMFAKSIAVMTVAAMTISPLTVFAAGASTPGYGDNVEIGGDGDLEYYENEVLSVTLPTSTVWDTPFVIDPQGALSITADDGAVVEAAKGAVVPQGIASIKNVSSSPVNVVASLYVAKNAEGEASSVTLVENSAATGLATSSDNKMNLQLLSTAKIKDADLTTLTSATKDHTLLANAKLTDKKDIMANGKENAMEVSFLLKGATYKLTQESGKKGWYLDSSVTDNYSQVAFCVGGKVAQKADWSAFTGDEAEKISLKAVFTLEKVADPDSVTADVTITASAATDPTYLVDTTVYDSASAGTTSATVTADYTVNTGADLELPIDLGKGGKKVTVGDVYATMGGGAAVLLEEGTDYEVTSTGITLKGDSEALWVFKWASEGNVIGIGCSDAEGNSAAWLNITFDSAE